MFVTAKNRPGLITNSDGLDQHHKNVGTNSYHVYRPSPKGKYSLDVQTV